MIFVDTGAWIALTDGSDQYHFNARRIYAALKRQHTTFLTTDYVIFAVLSCYFELKRRESCKSSMSIKPSSSKPL